MGMWSAHDNNSGWKLWLLIGLATPGLSCASFHSKPLVPARTASAFENRRLDSPDLKTFLEANLHHPLPSWPVREWDLETLTLVAFYYHPDLEVARARVSLAEAGVVTAGGRPNPSVGFSPEAMTNAVAGVSPWTLGVTFDVPLETAGKRGHRIARAKALTEAARLELAEATWRIRSRLRAALLESLVARRELAVWRAEESLRSDALTLMEQRYAAGRVSLQELTTARANLAHTTLAVRAAEGRLADRRSAVATALGLPVTALEGLGCSWPQLDAPPSKEILSSPAIQRAGLLNRLDIHRALAEYAAVEAALRLEIAKQYPDIHLGPGYTWDQGDHKFSLGLSITLPILNQNQGSIAEAEARRKEAAARFLALQAQVIGELDQARAQYEAALRELTEANRTLIETRQRQASMVQTGVSGMTDPLVLTELLTQRTIATRARLETLQKAQTALGALEDAIQRPLDSSTMQDKP